MKPNCWDCQHHGSIPGDAHLRCLHPKIGPQSSNEFTAMVDMLAGKTRNAAKELGVTGHPTGIARGWFMWPANFDPTWLLTCNGFEATPKSAGDR